jgi:pimeloyl-ACP methyl ester carboxylesterase
MNIRPSVTHLVAGCAKLALALALALGAGNAAQAATASATTPDWAREARLDAQIRDAILDGEPLDLEADGRSFLAIEMEPEEGESRGGVILMHGRGFDPDWHQVVGPLRVSLGEAGWRTLSIQMPVLEKSAKYYDYEPLFSHAHGRIDAAIKHLMKQGEKRIIVVAHSCSVHMVMDYLRRAEPVASIDAFVGIGMGATDYRQPMSEAMPLASLKFPVLDIRGEDDFPAVHRFAPRRLEAMRAAGNPASQQVEIAGADHYFEEAPEALHETIAAWLLGLPK